MNTTPTATTTTATTTTAKRTIRLTARTVASLKATGRQRDVYDSVQPGLTLRIGANGSKSWTLLYYVRTRKRRWTIGPADKRGAIPLESARNKAASALAALRDKGIDPGEAQRAARTAETFGDLVAEYLKAAKQPPPIGKKSWPEDERILRKLFLPNWKHRTAKEISRRDVRAVVEEIAPRAPVAANRALACVSAVFTFGVKRDWLDANPASLIDRQPETTRDRWLTDDELRQLWSALDDARVLKRASAETGGPAVTPMIARGLQTILLTAQRPGEVFGMRWADVDRAERVWTIPATRTKNGVAHRVPLTPAVLALLDEAAAAPTAKDNRFVFAGEQGASVEARAKKAMSSLRRANAITFDIHRHDLRRTAATLMEAAGVQPFHIAKVLNHTIRDVGRVTSVYTRHPYDAEKRTALETLDRRIASILAARDQSRVVPFAR